MSAETEDQKLAKGIAKVIVPNIALVDENPKAAKQAYWLARQAIEKAARAGDDETLKALAKIYPEVFRNLVNQAQNAIKPVIEVVK